LAALSSAISAEALTLDQALAMLALVSWETLADDEGVTTATTAIETVLQWLADGPSQGTRSSRLPKPLLLGSPRQAFRNAISRAGGSEALLDKSTISSPPACRPGSSCG